MKQKTRRRSYKNAIAIAFASFASIALISTGLAAFVIIRDADEKVDGNITVGEVKDSDITLALTSTTTGLNINLDAEKNDNAGRIQVEKNGTGAVLTHTVVGTVSVGTGKTFEDNLDLYFLVNIKDDHGSVANSTFETQYKTPGRLTYVGFSEFATATTITPVSDEGSETNANFSFTFGFAWGSKYDDMNPSVYYDSPEAGKDTPIAAVVDELNELRAANGYTFEITIHAKNK